MWQFNMKQLFVRAGLLAILALFAPQLARAAFAKTIYVNDDAQGNNTGATWANAYTKLQDALTKANGGDEIWVAAGVYYPDEGVGQSDNDPSATFQLKNGIKLLGGFVGNELIAQARNPRENRTILSGDIDQNDTNTDGNHVAESWRQVAGANTARVVIADSVDNTTTIDGFTITAGDNTTSIGGGMEIVGPPSKPMLTNLIFAGNQAVAGGGLFIAYRAAPTLVNTTFIGNHAEGVGGAIALGDSDLTLTNAVFTGNSVAGGYGSAISTQDSCMVTVSNATFSNNTGVTLINWPFTTMILKNVILWENIGPEIINFSQGATQAKTHIANSLIQGSGGSGSAWTPDLGVDGGGNLDSDPLFVDANGPDDVVGTADDNLHLLIGSPAIDRGDNTANTQATDLDGAPRQINNTIDLGAYEGGVVPPEPGGPSAINDAVQILEDEASLVNVLNNDSDGQGSPITISAVDAPAQGSAVIEGNAIRYTPLPGFAGVDSFRYTIHNDINKTATANVFVTVQAINDPPTNLTLSNDKATAAQDPWNPWNSATFLSSLASGSLIGVFSTTDIDPNDSHIYSLIGASPDPFAIAGNELRTTGVIKVAHGTFRQFTLGVRSRDLLGAVFDRSFTITIFAPTAPDGPIAISLSNEQIAENQPAGTTIGVFRTTDSKSTVHSYAFAPGPGSDDNNRFSISNNSLQATAPLDYEARESYSVRVRSANEHGAVIEQHLTIAVIDDNSEAGEPSPQNCASSALTLFETAEATVALSALNASNVSATGCHLTGKMRVKIRGSEATGIDFSGRVDERNQIYSNSSVQAALQLAGQQVVSAERQAMRISGFTLTVAGLTLKVAEAELEYYLGRPSLRLTDSQWCIPQAWGGLCTPIGASTLLIDGSGLKPGINVSFPLPEIKLGNGPTLSGLSGGLKPVAGGYEISAGGEFGFPKLPKGAAGCALAASFTIYVNAVTGATVIELQAAAQPQTSTAPDGAALREVSFSLGCSKGISIDTTGFQLTSVNGTIALLPGQQSINLGVTIETEGKIGTFSVASLKGDAKLLWDPVWGFDLTATLKLLNYFEASRAEMKIRPNRFQFKGHVTSLTTDFDMMLNAWTDSGSRFHMTGTGELSLGIEKGKIFSASKNECRDVTKQTCEIIGVVIDVLSFGFADGEKVCKNVAQRICDITSIAIPPWPLTVGKLKGEFGDFTNGKWGVKTSVQRGQIIGAYGQEILDVFGVPSEFGVYIDSSGNFFVGGTQSYMLLTPPPIQAAQQRWQTVQAAQANGAGMSLVEDTQLNFVSENEVLVAVPLSLNPANTINAASVISQVRVSAPTTVTFILAANAAPTMSLIAPNGTKINATNYNQPPLSQSYRINYAQRTIYEVLQQSDTPDRQGTRLRFIPIANHPSLAAVDVLLDGVPVWRNVKAYNPALPDPDYGGDYIAIEPGLHTLALAPTGQSTIIVSTTLETRLGRAYTVFSAPLDPKIDSGVDLPKLSVVTDENATPPSFGQPYVRFIHVGDTSRRLTVLVNGVPMFGELSYLDASGYQLLPAGVVKIAVKDAATGETLTPEHLLPLNQASLAATFFLFDHNTDNSRFGFTGVLDDLYLPHIYTIYQVGGAEMGLWQVDVLGQLDDPGLALSVVAFANPTQLSNVTVDASNPSQTKVNWTVKSEFAPTIISLYANPAELTSPLSFTDTNGISVTEQITNYMGFLVTQVTVTDPAQLDNTVGQLTADLSKLESGNYRLWLQVNDDINPPRSLYARALGTQEIAVITVNNAANFPTTWSPTITPTVNIERALISVEWTGIVHPDIDSYTLHIGATPGSSARTDSDLVAYFERDAAGNPVGGPQVIGNFSNIQPGQTNFLYIEAVDVESGRVVRSPDFSVIIPAGDYALTTPTNEYAVQVGQTVMAPLSLNVLSPLFDPDVALVIADEDLPSGIRVQFEGDTLGQTVLRSIANPLVVTASGATSLVQVVQNQDNLNARPDQQTVNVVITVGANVPPGLYPLNIAGYNSASGIRTRTISLQVVASNYHIFLPVVTRQ